MVQRKRAIMTYQGTVKGGVVILEGEPVPPDGTRVEVRLVQDKQPPLWAEVFEGLIGSASELPADIAENHDHYVHGAPKGIDNE